MRFVKRGEAVSLLFAVSILASTASGQSLTFDALPDSTILVTQYPGITFVNTAVLSAGITLNEFEFPAHSGTNVASDNGGPVTITFGSPVQSVSGYFTYSVPLTLQAFDASNNLVASAASWYSNNQALSGTPGSQPGEPIAVNAPVNIATVVITGAAGGASFTMDDLTLSLFTQCDLSQAGTASVADAQRVINEASGATTPTHDLNQDGFVNVVDVQIVIDAALTLGCSAR